MKTYTGGCHCGAVTFSATAEITKAIRCNCSHCHKKGFVLAFIPAKQFTLTSGDAALTTYHFNKKKIDHRFCSTCGVQPFGTADEMVALNLNCVDDFDLASVSVDLVDGKNF